MMSNFRLAPLLALAALAISSAGCSWVPKIKVPFTGGAAAGPDPQIAFDARRPLSHGHTLRLVVYRNLLSRSRIFDGSVMVDQSGMIHFKTAGSVRVAGRSALEAVKAIEAAFSRQYGESTVTVQLAAIENVPVVTVIGAVRSPSVIPWFDHMTSDDAARSVGGRRGQSDARSVYITRKGSRHFHAEGLGVSLQAGDLVNFSRDI